MSKSVSLILGAVPWEIKLLTKHLENEKTEALSGFPYYAGKFAGEKVVMAITGVGKTNAAMISTLFISKFAPERLIYTGTAARVNRELRTGDIILGKKTIHHDCGSLQKDGMIYRKIIGPIASAQTHFQYASDADLLKLAVQAAKTYAPKPITANGSTYTPNVRPGLICSGDVFGMTEEKLSDIRAKLKAELVEMEGSAIGQVCTYLKVPHLVIRGGSNLAQESPGEDYKRLGQIAAVSAASFTLHFMHHLAKSA